MTFPVPVKRPRVPVSFLARIICKFPSPRGLIRLLVHRAPVCVSILSTVSIPFFPPLGFTISFFLPRVSFPVLFIIPRGERLARRASAWPQTAAPAEAPDAGLGCTREGIFHSFLECGFSRAAEGRRSHGSASPSVKWGQCQRPLLGL